MQNVKKSAARYSVFVYRVPTLLFNSSKRSCLVPTVERKNKLNRWREKMIAFNSAKKGDKEKEENH